jgi:hypothetical protein
MALGFDKDCPTGFETPERIVQTTGNGHKLGRHGAIEVGSPKPCSPLERPILVEDDALVDERTPRQEISQTGVRAAIFCKIHHL